jgi:HlyD family secretion protein
MKMIKILLIIVAVVGVGAIVYVNMTADSRQKTEVNAQVVAQQDLTEKVSASGRIQPKSKVNITAEVSGKVIALPVKEGDTVDTGELLVLIDTIQAKSDLDQARYTFNEVTARMTGVKSDLEQAEREFNRQKQLYDNGLTSETQFDNARYAFESAKSGYEATAASAKQSQAYFEKASDNLKKTKISAPMPGIITFVDVEVGEIAPAQNAFTQGKTLLTISNLNIFEVEVEVDETEVAKVDIGQRAEISVDAFPDTTFPGEVVEIGNTAIIDGLGSQDQSTNFKVTVVFQGAEVKVRPGMSATVDITTASKDDVLSIPYSAVVVRSFDMDSLKASRESQASNSSAVSEVHAAESVSDSASSGEKEKKETKGAFVIRDGKALFVEISTGIADQKNIQVSSGLQAGDSVISGPYRVLRTIKDGDVVKVIHEEGTGDGKESKS